LGREGDDLLTIRGGAGTAVVSTAGAEPQSFRDVHGQEYLWQAGPQWRRRAPVLFPVVCRVVDDELRVGGVAHPMPQHGFARDLPWSVQSVAADAVTLALTDTEETRRRYPFRFTLTATYEVDDDGLSTTYVVLNNGETAMPFQLGSHPAFRWPLSADDDKDAHSVVFAQPQADHIRRVEQTLLRPEAHASPIHDGVLPLSEDLFRDNAVVLDTLAGRELLYRGPSGRGLRLRWDGFTQLAIWSPTAGAELICIEPWRGLPAPVGAQAEFGDRPDVHVVDAGGIARFAYRMEPVTDGADGSSPGAPSVR
jgi:galactose mutarotase-like enzyme